MDGCGSRWTNAFQLLLENRLEMSLMTFEANIQGQEAEHSKLRVNSGFAHLSECNLLKRLFIVNLYK